LGMFALMSVQPYCWLKQQDKREKTKEKRSKSFFMGLRFCLVVIANPAMDSGLCEAICYETGLNILFIS
jgi:hypothetical protein